MPTMTNANDTIEVANGFHAERACSILFRATTASRGTSTWSTTRSQDDLMTLEMSLTWLRARSRTATIHLASCRRWIRGTTAASPGAAPAAPRHAPANPSAARRQAYRLRPYAARCRERRARGRAAPPGQRTSPASSDRPASRGCCRPCTGPPRRCRSATDRAGPARRGSHWPLRAYHWRWSWCAWPSPGPHRRSSD